MSPRLLLLAASALLLSVPALAADAPGGSDGAPVSTSQSTDQKIAAWLSDSTPAAPAKTKDKLESPLRDPGDGQPDRKIHGEFGAGVGSGGYRSAYGVATIPIGQSSSVTVAVSSSHGRVPWVAGAPWSVGPAGPGIRADCVCREAPDGETECRVADAASPMDAQLAQGACDSVAP